jgi:hypothetical protein
LADQKELKLVEPLAVAMAALTAEHWVDWMVDQTAVVKAVLTAAQMAEYSVGHSVDHLVVWRVDRLVAQSADEWVG